MKSDASRRPDARRLLLFWAMGGAAAVLGPSLPTVAQRLDVDLGQASLAVSGLFAGLVVGVLFTAITSARISPTASWRTGAILQAMGLLVAGGSGHLLFWITGATVLGMGFGISEVTISWTTSQQEPSGRWMTLLGAVFAAGAISTPLAVSLALTMGMPFETVFALLAAILLVAGLSGQPAGVAVNQQNQQSAQPNRAIRPALLVLATAYVGAETVLATWATPLSVLLLDLTPAVAAWATTGFWTSLIIGRTVGAHLLRHRPANQVLSTCLAVAIFAIGSASFALTAAPQLALALLALGVVGIGPVYGLVLTYAGTASPRSPSAVAASILVGALGGIAAPLAIARWATTTPALITVAAAGLLAISLLAVPRASQATTASP